MAIFDKGDKMANDTSTTIISKGSKISGEFTLTAKLHIDGEVDGKVNSSNLVSIGKDGKFTGEMKVKKLLLNGVFEGKIEAEIIEITNGGKLIGEIIIENLIIEKGAIFEGTSTLKQKVSENASKKS